MFATFKGMDSKDIPDAVNKMIEDMDLTEKRNQRAKTLSGG